MRRALFALACVATFGAAYYFRCLHRDAKRHPLGGVRCPTCGCAFSDLGEAGLMDGGAYVPPLRRGVRGNGIERSDRSES